MLSCCLTDLRVHVALAPLENVKELPKIRIMISCGGRYSFSKQQNST